MAIEDISKILSPRRGSAATMASDAKKSIVLAKGELFIEYPNTGVGTGPVKVKIGDGATAYSALPYAIANDASAEVITYTDDASTTVAAALANAASGKSVASIVAGLKQAINLVDTYATAHVENGDIHVTAQQKLDWQATTDNAVETLIVDGNTYTATDNTATFDTPDYTVSVAAVEGADNKVTVSLNPEDGYNKTASTFNITSDGNVGVAIVDGEIKLSTDPYVHPESGVTAGTYKSVTVNEYGHVTAGTNPTTLAGYGITDAQGTITGAATTITDDDLTASMALVSNAEGKVAVSTATATEVGYLSGVTAAIQTQINGKANTAHSHDNDEIISIDASKITTGTIDIARLPQGALERLVIVADEEAMLALTTDDVQTGDVVKVESTQLMYFVKDESKLGTMDAFEIFKAGEAASVEWANVQNKPETYPPSAHTHTMSEITDLYGNFGGATAESAGTTGFVPAPVAGDEAKYLAGNGTWVAFTLATTTTAGLMSAEDKQVVELAKTGIWDFGDVAEEPEA